MRVLFSCYSYIRYFSVVINTVACMLIPHWSNTHHPFPFVGVLSLVVGLQILKVAQCIAAFIILLYAV
uniref:Uncharacterized protein n=1 Tax=Rhizophora mucronata TaxID=61149 RepID=A0A2P2Q3H7_RHIMU